MGIRVSPVGRLISSDGKDILEVAGRPLLELNTVAAIIWSELAAGVGPTEIVSQIAARYDVSEEQARRDVSNLIRDLKQRLLVYQDS